MSINRPYVSVLIPMYNRERFIIQSINSVLNQKFQDFEIVIVDDRSQDRSVELAKSFDDKRIVIIENPTNLGIPKTRNIKCVFLSIIVIMLVAGHGATLLVVMEKY